MDKDEVSDAILVGLTMPAQLQKHKIEVLQRRLKEYTVMHWITDFIRQLDETKSLQQLQETKFLTNEATAEIKIKYASAKSRLLLLDYDGTLVPFSRHPLSAVPGEKINSLLSQLANDISTNVTIISGRDSDSLERWFGGLPITLISEHGASIKNRNGTWQHDPSIDQSWKVFIRPVLEVFTQRSPGSFIEDKMHTLVWHYRNVEAELGFIRSRELLDNLHHLTRNANLHILDGNKVIEARVSNVNKGAVTKRVLEEGDYDFVLAIGDDKTDEDMFRVLGEKGFTIKIGAGHTVAQYFLPNQEDVIFLLNQLVKASTVLSE
jgi:trehalose 6-phosphate synthase/phosphatase